MFAEVGLITGAAELLGWGWALSKARQMQIDRVLTGKKHGKEFPVFDRQVKRLVGANPTKLQKSMASKVITASRFIVSTKSFETLIYGLVDPNSKIKKNANKLAKNSTIWARKYREFTV